MKNLKSFLLIGLLAIGICFLGITHAKAQNNHKSYVLTIKNAVGTTVAADTTTNTDTTYLQYTSDNLYDMLFKATITKLSGTVAGSIRFQGSDDGSIWFTLANHVSGVVSSQYADTATVANATGSYYFFDGGPDIHHWLYHRMMYISSGTMTAKPTGTVYLYPTPKQ